ncbi:hypothetical protein GDO78_021986 [Eleutherodactylus coqui]|uniref:Uncharacterized protein n=1 Tax=Eleutherodactylus coqui TaxID=57060 RepID=A0A8J6BI40_ELECQ|nr:hypothetical protein GDO78_021986 [Eleutherodactylus coqui]
MAYPQDWSSIVDCAGVLSPGNPASKLLSGPIHLCTKSIPAGSRQLCSHCSDQAWIAGQGSTEMNWSCVCNTKPGHCSENEAVCFPQESA